MCVCATLFPKKYHTSISMPLAFPTFFPLKSELKLFEVSKYPIFKLHFVEIEIRFLFNLGKIDNLARAKHNVSSS